MSAWNRRAGGVGPTPRPPAVAVRPATSCSSARRTVRCASFDASTFELDRTIELAPDTLAALRPLDDGTLVTAGRRRHRARRSRQRASALAARQRASRPSATAHRRRPAPTSPCSSRGARSTAATPTAGSPSTTSRAGYAIRVLDAQNGNSGSLWPARDGTELVSFGDNEPVVSRWRLDGSGPITHLVAARVPGLAVQPGRRPAARRARRRPSTAEPEPGDRRRDRSRSCARSTG